MDFTSKTPRYSCFVSHIKRCPLYAPENQNYEVSTLLFDRLSLTSRKTTSLNYTAHSEGQADHCSKLAIYPSGVIMSWIVNKWMHAQRDQHWPFHSSTA